MRSIFDPFLGLFHRATSYSIDNPKKTLAFTLGFTALMACTFPFMVIDTDPENMLEKDQEDRVFYNGVKKKYRIYDEIGIAIYHPTDILEPKSLEAIDRATRRLMEIEGVISRDVVSLSTSYNLLRLDYAHAADPLDADGIMTIPPYNIGYSGGVSTGKLPQTPEEVEELWYHLKANWLSENQIVTWDRKATGIGLPIVDKNLSYEIKQSVVKILNEELLPEHVVHITGIPIAEDQFGVEMFHQMGVVAPGAFIFIMIIVFLLYRQPHFLIPMGIDSGCSVIWAMGLLILSGQTVHIMSSMIPIFIMPVALLDDMHILSSFFDKYAVLRDRRKAVAEAMDHNYVPMLMTSFTSFFGYGALLLTNIPPIRVFGFFVALGMLFGFWLSITVVPACIMLIPQKRLDTIKIRDERHPSKLDKILRPLGKFAYNHSFPIFLGGVAVTVLSIWGIFKTVINDNPINWFVEKHEIRVADRLMNHDFTGAYPVYFVGTSTIPEYMVEPEIAKYMYRLEKHIASHPTVGRVVSSWDVVSLTRKRMHNNDPAYEALNPTKEGIVQMLWLYESGADPLDLDTSFSRDRSSGVLCTIMNRGDNTDMEEVEAWSYKFLKENPPPRGIEFRWSGLPYINKTWQNIMVGGTWAADAFSYGACFLLIVFQFRSLFLGLLGALPLILSVLACYGFVGWIGKDFDMPIAVCSSLAVGEGIDFGIHYIEHWRGFLAEGHDPEKVNTIMFDEVGRSIARNVIVISVGFLPLIFSHLIPYITTGVFFAGLMFTSGITTFILLPGLLKFWARRYGKDFVAKYGTDAAHEKAA
jgi:uncharacterized protein